MRIRIEVVTNWRGGITDQWIEWDWDSCDAQVRQWGQAKQSSDASRTFAWGNFLNDADSSRAYSGDISRTPGATAISSYRSIVLQIIVSKTNAITQIPKRGQEKNEIRHQCLNIEALRGESHFSSICSEEIRTYPNAKSMNSLCHSALTDSPYLLLSPSGSGRERNLAVRKVRSHPIRVPDKEKSL